MHFRSCDDRLTAGFIFIHDLTPSAQLATHHDAISTPNGAQPEFLALAVRYQPLPQAYVCNDMASAIRL